MRKITNNTINFNANALNSSIIASTISYAGNGYDGFLFGDDVNFEQLTAYCVLCEANHFEAPNNGIEGFARLAQVYYNTVEYRNFTGIGSVQQLREYDEVPEKLEVRLNGWRPEEYISTLGDTYSILPLTTSIRSANMRSTSIQCSPNAFVCLMIRSMLTSPMPSLRVNTLSLRRIKKIAALRGRFFFLFFATG